MVCRRDMYYGTAGFVLWFSCFVLLACSSVGGADDTIRANTPLNTDPAGRPLIAPPSSTALSGLSTQEVSTPQRATATSQPKSTGNSESAQTTKSSGRTTIPSTADSADTLAAADEFERQTLQRTPIRSESNGESKENVTTEKKQNPSAWQAVFSLTVVLVLIVLVGYLFRRFMPGSRSGKVNSAIEILARNTIGPKQSLCLVKLGQRLILVGVSPNHIAGLLTVEDPDEIACIRGTLEQHLPSSISSGFEKLFNREAREYDELMDGPENVADAGDAHIFDHETRKPQQSNCADGELSSLLSKVKGLARMRFRSNQG